MDASIFLEIYKKLKKMPGLCRWLTVKDVAPRMKVDIVPMTGTVVATNIATRVATVTLLGVRPLECPRGIVPATKINSLSGNLKLSAGDGRCVVET